MNKNQYVIKRTTKEPELFPELQCNINIKKMLQVFNDNFNQFDDYKICLEFDDKEPIVNIEKQNVDNLYLGVDIRYSENNKKFTLKYTSFDEHKCLKPLEAKVSSSPKGEFSYKEAALVLYKLIEEQIQTTNNILKTMKELAIETNK